MLALTRRSGEAIIITDAETGDEIIIAVEGHTARIAIEAPERFRIAREELLEEPD